MSIYERVLDSLQRGTVMPLYLLYGEEKYLIEQLLEAFQRHLLPDPSLKSFNFDQLDGAVCSAEQVIESANNLPMLAEKRLVIVRNARFFGSSCSKSEQKILLSYFKDPSSATCLVFTSSTADKRLKQFKELSANGLAGELLPLKGDEIEKWIKTRAGNQGKKISREALEQFQLLTINSLQIMDNELNKLFTYAGERELINKTDVDAVISSTAEYNIFRTVDMLSEGKTEQALSDINRMLDEGEAPLRILAMVIRQFNILIQIRDMKQRHYTKREMAGRLHLPGFVIDKSCRQAAAFSRQELIAVLRGLWDIDRELKGGDQDLLGQLEMIFWDIRINRRK